MVYLRRAILYEIGFGFLFVLIALAIISWLGIEDGTIGLLIGGGAGVLAVAAGCSLSLYVTDRRGEL